MSHAELCENLSYDKETGIFTWLINKKNARVGNRAGFFTQPGYRGIGYKNKRYEEHRLAWFITYGTWPELIDHKNGDGTDNRIENLRVATPSQNQWNKRKPKNNKSGFKGVSWNIRAKKWQVFIRVNGKNKALGQYVDIEKAAKAYEDFAKKHHGEFFCRSS